MVNYNILCFWLYIFDKKKDSLKVKYETIT